MSALIELINAKSSRVIVGKADSEMHDADRMLKETGIGKAAADLGAEVVNLSKGAMVKKEVPDGYVLKELESSKAIAEADKLLSVPVVKTHSNTEVTLSLKCMFSVLPEKHKAKYHKMGLNVVIVAIVKTFPRHLSVVDAVTGMEGEGPFKGNPTELNLIICGDNAVATDSAVASVLGYNSVKIKHFKLAAKRGLGPLNLDEIEIVGDKAAKREFKKVPIGIRLVGKLTGSLFSEKD